MTTESRTILLGHASDLESGHHGLPGVAKLIRQVVVKADGVNELEERVSALEGERNDLNRRLEEANETIKVLRTPPQGTGGT